MADSAHPKETDPDSKTKQTPATKMTGDHPPAKRGDGAAKILGAFISIVVLVVTGVLALVVWGIMEKHPRTDDATVRANVVGIAPRVRGQIVKLHVVDNQAVREGDLLFEIDPEEYQLAVERAAAALASLDQQIVAARAQDVTLKLAVKVEEASVDRARAQLKQAEDSLGRLQPLLPKGFATAEQVDQAQTAKATAQASLASEVERLNQAKAAVSTLDTLSAQRPASDAALRSAKLDLSYCKVLAPFPGRVVNLNISEGAYANAGMTVFALLDTRRWYVLANFREGEIRHMAPGTRAEVYLTSAPERRFHAIVQGVSWAVKPDGEIDLPNGIPLVKRELNWVHIAQRFPVRLEVEQPDPELFRMGASAVAIISGKEEP